MMMMMYEFGGFAGWMDGWMDRKEGCPAGMHGAFQVLKAHDVMA